MSTSGSGRLARETAFFLAQQDVISAEPLPPLLKTFGALLEAAVAPEDVATMAECCLLRACRPVARQAKESPLEALQKSGRLPRALSLAQL